MRPIGFTFVFFMYFMSAGAFITDTVFLEPIGMGITGLSGDEINGQLIFDEFTNSTDIGNAANATANPSLNDNPIDRVVLFTQGGYASVWTLLSMLSGTYAFSLLALLGVPAVFVFVIQLIFGFSVVFTIVYYLTGR